jgi:DNA (cytosine-5)-methyltransferase 1
MSEVFLFPRLPIGAARTRVAEITGKSAQELLATYVLSSTDAIYPATGGTRLTLDRLEKLRAELLTCARQLGFPSTERMEPASFDRAAAVALLQYLPIQPGEASRTDVWSFITLRVFPDIATWRFPKQNERRLLGGVRNTFQRLWWRAYLLHDPSEADPWHLLKLPEDALVGLFERPGISSNPHVTRSIAKAIVAIIESVPSAHQEGGWRLAYKRIRQRVPLVNLDALDEPELQGQLEAICTAVAKQVRELKTH